MSGFKLQRLGMLMEPEPGNPQEVEGVLNPAAARGPDGRSTCFPRLVARGNYSRIGIARVRFNEAGDPAGVERLGIALEPEADYERRPDGGGGCEDPRITFVEPLQRYMMTYTAFSPKAHGSPWPYRRTCFHWKRWGSRPLVRITASNSARGRQRCQPLPRRHSESIRASRAGHAPPAAFPGTRPEETACHPASREVDLDRESIWISYCPMALEGHEPYRLGQFTSHHRLATPVSPWERLKIGGGTPPILTRHGWLIVYHGVSEMAEPSNDGHHLCYSAGVMVLSKEHPRVIRYRSAEPVLTPVLPQERHGTVANVVFPTGIDRRDDLGSPDRFDVYYGMADSRIGVARLDVPDFVPPGGVADPPEAKV
jgi:predicted GH43/DUF377 family glycosyl hydrolase